jgi:hypothetical protein
MLLWDIPVQDTLVPVLRFSGHCVVAKLGALLMVLTLCGCAQTQLVNRVNPRAHASVDRAACEQEAWAKYPDVVVPVKPSPAQFTTNCQRVGTQMSCTTKQVDTSIQDRNAAQIQQGIRNGGQGISRSLEVGNCMKRRGWVSEPVN